jgi:hypothetical protein
MVHQRYAHASLVNHLLGIDRTQDFIVKEIEDLMTSVYMSRSIHCVLNAYCLTLRIMSNK